MVEGALFRIGITGLTLTGAYLQAKRQQAGMSANVGHASLTFAYFFTVAAIGFAVWGGYQETLAYGLNGSFPDVPAPTVAVIAVWCCSTILALTTWMWKVRP
jgi:hypothetical protein